MATTEAVPVRAGEQVIDEATGTALVEVKHAAEVVPVLDLGGVQLTMGDAFRMADALCQSTTLPKWIGGTGDVLACMLKANQTGLPLMAVIDGSHFIEGKLTMSPDLMLAAVRASGELERFSRDEYTDKACQITMKRRGYGEVTERFTIDDAKAADLSGKQNWKRYPKRMLYHRCLGFICRDLFGDILVGNYTPDELGAVTVEDGSVPDKARGQEAADAARTVHELDALWDRVHGLTSFHEAKTAYQAALRATEEANRAGHLGTSGGHFSARRDRAKDHLLKLRGDSIDHEAAGQQAVAEAEEADADAAAGDQAGGAFDGPEYHEGLGDDLDAEASPSDLEG